VLLDDGVDDTRPIPLEQRFASLPEALAAAAQQLEAIRDGLDASDPARGMVDFQIEFLGDPALLECAGNPSLVLPAEEEVWRQIIEAHIADFDAAEDEYFRHRASDLRDIRERVLRVLNRTRASTIPALGDHAVVVAHDLSPSRFLSAAWKPTQALVLRGGSPHAHIALLARARALPMVVAVGAAPIGAGERALVDGAAGTLELNPGPERIQVLMQAQQRQTLQKTLEAERLFQPATTTTGEVVSVMINVASLSELDQVNPACCDGIGLVRTELLFAQGVPTEEEQLGFYRQLLVWAKGKPVVVRTLDAGGDKPVPGLGMPRETNPFLGLRGLRLCLREPEVFRLQLRALLRAAAEGDLRIMLPMLTNTAELTAAREHLKACAQALREADIPHRTPPLGVMVEVPALALALESLGPIDFASVGSNDLLQYAMAAARDLPEVAPLANPQHPGFERLMRILTESARAAAIPLSICGDLAGQAAHIPALLRHGLRSLSVPVAAIGITKLAVAAWPLQTPHG
jgi:phosphotransferase system enzyme I (PtsI)